MLPGWAGAGERNAVALYWVKAHRQSQWRSPNFTPLPCKIDTPSIKLRPRNYLGYIYPYAKFCCSRFTGSLFPNLLNVTVL